MSYILNGLIGLPIGAGLIVLTMHNKPSTARLVSLLTIIVTLGLCWPLYQDFSFQAEGMQYIVEQAWLPDLGITYHVGIDGLSLLLIILTVFTNLIVILATWDSIKTKLHQYLAAFLIMQGLLVGVFSAMDAILFYLFWEATLIPMYLIIGIWGSSHRVYAAIKFFLYTFLGSVLMLIALLYMGFQAGSFDIETFYALKLNLPTQLFIFIAFFFAFAIKVPMVPVHTWLPDAHTEAPAGGSIVLAAILLKLGAYGFIRFTLPIVPNACQVFAPWMIGLSLIAIIYIGLIALIQEDLKKLIAYSSISHMGFVTLGCFAIFSLTQSIHLPIAGLILEGAIVIMISHAFISSALFAGIGFIYDRLHTRQIADLKGIVNTMPYFATFFVFFALANAGLPGTSGFVGEWMMILGSMQVGFGVACLAALTLILSAAYNLWMVKRVIFGATASHRSTLLTDLSIYEKLAYILLALVVIGIGVYPQMILKAIHQSVYTTLLQSDRTYDKLRNLEEQSGLQDLQKTPMSMRIVREQRSLHASK